MTEIFSTASPPQLRIGLGSGDLDELRGSVVDEESLDDLLFHFAVGLAAIESEERGYRFLSRNAESVDCRLSDFRRLSFIGRHLGELFVVPGDRERVKDLLLGLERGCLLEETPERLLGSFGSEELDRGAAQLRSRLGITGDFEKMRLVSRDHECLEHLLLDV